MAIINQSGQLKTGCAVLFALPFAAVGIGMTCWLTWIAIQHSAVQTWVEVPTTIKTVELKEKRGNKGKTTYQAAATYTYEFNGNPYNGDRVSLQGGSDNFGSFQRRAYDELKRHHDSRQPFRAYVNPDDPAESILYRHLRWELMAFFSIFATVFGAAGLGMMAGALVSARRTASTPDAPENEPWKARADWASGRILDAGGAAVVVPVLAVVAIWWWIASAPLSTKLIGLLRTAESPWRWVTLSFPAVGALLLIALLYQIVRRRKYGESVLQLAATPGVVGGQLAGMVQIPRQIHADGGFRLKLSCMERVLKRDNESHEEAIWQDEQIVAEPIVDPALGTTALPFMFAIPFEAQETSLSGTKRCIAWLLHVTANVPGVNYNARFEVPVFKTPESRGDFKPDEQLLADYVAAPPRDLVLRGAGIVKEPLPGEGVRLVFPALRNWKSALFVTVFLAFWSAAIWAMIQFRVPIIFPIVFGLIDLLVLWGALELWLYRSVVEARKDGLCWRGGLLGIGRTHTLAAEDLRRFTTSESMSSGHHVWKHLEVVPRQGKKRKIAKSIGGKLAQQAVIDELNAALGRI
jgi:hypothetical protein